MPLWVKPTWMAKMVMLIQPKKDGKSRRVVDMSALTKVARRELPIFSLLRGCSDLELCLTNNPAMCAWQTG